MKKLMTTAAAGLLLATVAMSASAASFSVDFMHGTRSPQAMLDYDYGQNQTLEVTGVNGYWGPNESAPVYQEHDWGLHVLSDGGSHGTSNVDASNYWKYEALVFDFGQVVSLDTLDISYAKEWHGNRMSLLALTDLDAPLNFNSTWSGLLDNGWQHAGDPNAYNNVDAYSTLDVEGGLLSRYWLISATNPAFGADATHWMDAFKLGGASFTVHDVPSEVPLPAAAWLFMTGLAGMGWMRKRKASRAK